MPAQRSSATRCCGVSGGTSSPSSEEIARAGEPGDTAVISDASTGGQAAADHGPRTTDHEPENKNASLQTLLTDERSRWRTDVHAFTAHKQASKKIPLV